MSLRKNLKDVWKSAIVLKSIKSNVISQIVVHIMGLLKAVCVWSI
jgi:hypothetical protein